MPFKLWFPGHPEYEPYTGLIDEDDVYEALKEEVTKVISDGVLYDPTEFTPVGYDSEQDQDGTIWNEAINDAIDHAVTMTLPQIHKELWQRYQIGEHGEQDIAVDNTTTSKLPDGTIIALTEES